MKLEIMGEKESFLFRKKKIQRKRQKLREGEGERKRIRELKRSESERGEGVITKRINQKTQFFKHANHL